MFAFPLRRILLAVASLLALVVVGGMSLMTFFIVARGMEDVYRDAARRTAVTAATVAGETSREVAQESGRSATSTAGLRSRIFQEFPKELDRTLAPAGFKDVDFALYDSSDHVVWSSGDSVASGRYTNARLKAAADNQPVESHEKADDWWHGVVQDANLGESVWHMPVRLPAGEVGVLDVRRTAADEEAVIDDVRLPMFALAFATAIGMVTLMQTSLIGVLRLVNTLREAADSITEGRLDARLPKIGNNEIGELARSINNLIERLQRRSEAQTQFVADASHELATPVAGIRGYTSILRGWGGEDPTIRQEAIEAIDRESRRMARLTSNLLSLLHANQGLRLRSERFDLNAVIRERLAACANRYTEKDIEFIGPTDEQLWVIGDPDRTEDVLGILIDNAGKYTPDGGTIRVDSTSEREIAVVRVKDTGQGIAADQLPNLFDRFFRSEEARSGSEGGFGLGLAIAKSIVDNMGGTISVESELGAGTVFTLIIPRRKG